MQNKFRTVALLIVVRMWSLSIDSHAATLDSYHRALELVERSITAHGGIEPIESSGGFQIVAQGTFDLATRLQGRSAFKPEPTPITERISYDVSSERVSYDINWFNYYSSNQDLREIHDKQNRVLFVDKANRNGGWLPYRTIEDQRKRFIRVLPQMLLFEALRERHSLRWAAQRESADRRSECISFTTSFGDALTVCMDSDNHLVTATSAVLEMPLLGDTQMDWRWSGYREIDNGFIAPSRLMVYLGDDVLKDVALEASLGFDSTAFDPPAGIEVDDPPDTMIPLSEFVPYGDRAPEVETLSPRVYMLNNLRPGFGLMFVEFDEYVVAIDAPTGWYEMNQLPPMNWSHGDSVDALGDKYLRAINETVPGKPVRYLVLTHHHSDHIGGLKPFVDAGATILAGKNAAHMAEIAVGSRATLSDDRTSRGEMRRPAIEIVTDHRSIADSSMAVQLIELPADNPKAENYLMVYLPEQKLLYTTAFIYPIPRSVYPPRESIPLSRYFVNWLDTSGLDVDQIYNVHGMGRVEDWHLQTIRDMPTTEGDAFARMRSTRPTILVTGATGRQGGAVARELASRGYDVRALTRNPGSKRAVELAALGIEVVAGNFDDLESLRNAMADAYGVFAMTDFWEHGYDREVEHGRNLVEAARQSGVQHFVYTSVASADHDTGIPHFDSKRAVEIVLETSSLNYTVVRPVSFMENWSLNDPEIIAGKILTASDIDKPHQHISVRDIARIVGVIFDSPHEWNGRSIDIAGDALSLREIGDLLATVTGREVGFKSIGWDEYQSRFGEDSAMMSRWFDDVGYSVDIDGLRRVFPRLTSFEAYLLAQQEAVNTD